MFSIKNTPVTLSTIVIIIFMLSGCISKQGKGTYDLYLIPEGYEGTILVTYNVKDAPPLAKEGKYDVIPVNEDGTYETSNPMYDYGTVIDQYFYVDSKGERKEIDSSCVHVLGTGGASSGGVDTHFTKIEVTHSACSESFKIEGK
jgi:hypothetical protein